MLVALVALAVYTALPMEPTPIVSCVSASQELPATAPSVSDDALYRMGEVRQITATAGVEYVLCEAEAGNVLDVLFTEGGAAVATM